MGLKKQFTFSQSIKNEIIHLDFSDQDYLKFLLKGFFHTNLSIVIKSNGLNYLITSYDSSIIRFIKQSLNLLFGDFDNNIFISESVNNKQYYLYFYGSKIEDIFENNGFIYKNKITEFNNKDLKKAYLCGCFLSSGSISNPTKSYHFELRINNQNLALDLIKIFKYFKLDLKMIFHHNKYVLYMKKGNLIADFMKLINLSQTLFNFEDIRIARDFTIQYRRINNLEVSNISKTINASNKQIYKLEVIKASIYWNDLDPIQKKCYELRYKNNDYSIQQIANKISSIFKINYSRSQVQNQLKKIDVLYEKLINK